MGFLKDMEKWETLRKENHSIVIDDIKKNNYEAFVIIMKDDFRTHSSYEDKKKCKIIDYIVNGITIMILVYQKSIQPEL